MSYDHWIKTVVDAAITVELENALHCAVNRVVVESAGVSTLPFVVVPIVKPLEVVTVQADVPTELHEIFEVPPLLTVAGLAVIATAPAGGAGVEASRAAFVGILGYGNGCGTGCRAASGAALLAWIGRA